MPVVSRGSELLNKARLQSANNPENFAKEHDLDWDSLQHLAGLRDEDYVTIGQEGSLRFGVDGHLPAQTEEDPVTALQMGIKVLMWEGPEGGFVHRIMKVDELLLFLYFIVDAAGQTNVKQEVNTLRLRTIERIYAGQEAMRIADLLEIQDHHLTPETVLIVATIPLSTLEKGEAPNPDSLILLMLSPKAKERVQDCLQAAKSQAPQHDPLSNETKISKAQELRKKQIGSSLTTNASTKMVQRLTRVKAKSPEDVINRNMTAVLFEICTRPEGRKNDTFDSHFTAPISLDIDPNHMESEIDKFESKLGQAFISIDEIRVAFALHESIHLRQWASTLTTPEGFKKGISEFITDTETKRSVLHQDECFSTVHRAVTNPESHGRVGDVDGASVRACCRALSSMLDLEQVFAHTIRLGVEQKILEAPRRMTIAGDVLPDGYDDDADAPLPPTDLSRTGNAAAAVPAASPAPGEEVKPLLDSTPPPRGGDFWSSRSGFSNPCTDRGKQFPCTARHESAR